MTITFVRPQHVSVFGLTLAAVATVLSSGPGVAADFYAGKQLKIVIGSDVGGGYDTYGRLLGRHIAGQIPGKPSTLVLNMPGAGGLKSVQYVYTVANRNGTEIANIRASNMLDAVLGIRGKEIDPAKFNWIGSMAADTDVCLFTKASGIRTFKDMLTKETTVGGTGKGAQAFSFPNSINHVLGTRMKIILGYKGTGDRVLAMERGELSGSCGINGSTFIAVLGRQFKEGSLIPVVQSGLAPNSRLKDVPLTLSYAKGEQRDVLEGVFSQMQIARPYAGPPEMAADKLAILRKAFDATMKDAKFLAEATKVKVEISPTDGAGAAEIIARMTRMSPDLRKKVRAAIGG
jgi:tripartite-type tricarboxylate transporter receptor subunit TctC